LAHLESPIVQLEVSRLASFSTVVPCRVGEAKLRRLQVLHATQVRTEIGW
jgi:hypothetical protein